MRTDGEESSIGGPDWTAERLEFLRRKADVILSTVVDGILMVETDGVVAYANRAALDLLRYESWELVGRNLHELMPPSGRADGDGLRCPYQRAVAEHRSTAERRTTLRRQDGTCFPAEVRAAPILEDDQAVGAVMTLRDLTERLESEDAQRRLAAILEATPDYVTSADPLGRLVYANTTVREAAGGRVLEGASMAALLVPESAREVLGPGISTAVKRGSWQGETALLLSDGSERILSQVLIAHRSEAGELIGLSSLARDVTDQKRAEQGQRFLAEASRVLAAELDLQATVDQIAHLAIPFFADLCLVAQPRDGKLVQVAHAHRFPGRRHLLEGLADACPPSSLVGLHAVQRSGQPELVPRITDAWLWAATEDADLYDRVRALGLRSLLILPLAIRGRRLGVIAFGSLERIFSNDDRRLSEEFAARAAQAMENARLYDSSIAATRLREELLNVVSHDLRNPLASVTLAARSLLRTLATPAQEKARRQAERILHAGERAVALIQDLLDVATIESTGLAIVKEPVSPQTLVSAAVEMHRPLAEEAGLRIEARLEGALPRIHADRERLQQVFSNLIGNAIKFTQPGGRIEVRAAARDDEVDFSITDTGKGIPPENLPHIFDRFWQASQRRGSIGLGLAISSGIVHAHGGWIDVTSEVGKGSTFTFSLPVDGGTEEARRSPNGRRIFRPAS